jgi:outer membrane lipoprotein-sorting protein
MTTLTRRDTFLLATTFMLSLAWPTRAAADDADACSPDRLEHAMADIAKARATVTTLSGPFTQDRTIGLLAAKVHSTGSLTLVRPGRLRWELAAPDDVTYWISPEGIAYRSPAGQGSVPIANQRMAAALDDLRLLRGGDLGGLRGRYDLTGTCHAVDPIVFRAVPKATTAASFREIRFTLAPDLVAPLSVTIVEGPRDRTEIHFGPLRANVPVPPEVMSPGAR